MPAIIEIDNLTHRFADGTVGLDGVSLEIAEGAFVVIAGANGSGKTTLLRHFNGLLQPTSGTVRVAGVVRGARTSLQRPHAGGHGVSGRRQPDRRRNGATTTWPSGPRT
ncbi:MAG: ATP-binding cassette domain-containing protein [Desulfobacterales bacterium]|nr:ATP-binding cassette domain-containing protein [Desulfobacterales bacterium]